MIHVTLKIGNISDRCSKYNIDLPKQNNGPGFRLSNQRWPQILLITAMVFEGEGRQIQYMFGPIPRTMNFILVEPKIAHGCSFNFYVIYSSVWQLLSVSYLIFNNNAQVFFLPWFDSISSCCMILDHLFSHE